MRGALIFLTILLWLGCSSENVNEIELESVPCLRDENGVTGPCIDDVVVHDRFSEAVSFAKPPAEYKGTPGIGIGFTMVEDLDLYPFARPQTEEFRLEEGQPFTPYLGILNGYTIPVTLLVTVILDYDQTEFNLDGKNGLLHEITVPPETDLGLLLHLEIAETGAHDLQVVAFEHPYSATLSDDFRVRTSGWAHDRRTVIIVGGDEAPAKDVEQVIKGIPHPATVFYKPAIGFATMDGFDGYHPSSPERQLFVARSTPGDTYQFQMVVNNREDQPTMQALVPFFDYHQIEIQGKDALFVELDSEQEAVIDVAVNLPEEPGVHQFQVIWVFDPYRSILNDEVYSSFVFDSGRMAIDTRSRETWTSFPMMVNSTIAFTRITNSRVEFTSKVS